VSRVQKIVQSGYGAGRCDLWLNNQPLLRRNAHRPVYVLNIVGEIPV
jgi:hypothetical protein